MVLFLIVFFYTIPPFIALTGFLFSGQGVKIAVVDLEYHGLQERINSGELPKNIKTRYFPTQGSATDTLRYANDLGPHGVACAEVIHDIAPDAELFLIQIDSTGLDTKMQEIVDYLQSQGVRIVSMSLGGVAQRGDGKGRAVYTALDDARNKKGMLLFVAAGNEGQKFYGGQFKDSDNDQWHEFGKTFLNSIDEDITLKANDSNDGQTATVVLSWDDWGNNPAQPTSSHNYDLYLYDDNGKELVSSKQVQNGDDFPVEFISYKLTHFSLIPYTSTKYHVRVKKEGTFTTVHNLRISVDFTTERGWFGLGSTNPIEHYTSKGSLGSPADAQSVFAVGAANVSNDKLESYSSQGPTTDGRVKPDITSYTSVKTASYTGAFVAGLITWGDFNGTSAATPHVAGMAGLLLSQNPNLGASDIESLLANFASDKGTTGKDSEWGYGLAKLPPLASQVVIDSPSQAAPDLVGNHMNPVKTWVDIIVKNSNNEIIPGLNAANFMIKIGNQDAKIVTLRQKSDRYTLEILPPSQPTEDSYDLSVTVLGKNDTEARSIQYLSLAKTNADTVLVIDRSGSMGGTPLDNAKNSASLFVDLVNLDDGIGVVSFDDFVTTNFPLTAVQADSVRGQAKTAISLIQSGNSTSIGGGLEGAKNQLINSGNNNHSWNIVLLSDGRENSSPYVNAVLPSILATKIKVFTVGLGDVDESQLQNIAQQSGGEYYHTPSEAELVAIYSNLVGQVTGRQTVYNLISSVGQGETKMDRIQVDSTVHEAIFSLSWNNANSRLSLVLKSPLGTTIDPQVAQTDPDIEFISGSTYQYYRIRNPKAGTWQTSVTGVTTALTSQGISAATVILAGESYNLEVQGVTNLTLDVAFDKTSYVPGDVINIQASLAETSPVLDARVVARILRPDSNISTLILYDDGKHSDGIAGDGVYGGFYTNTRHTGSYRVNIDATRMTPNGQEFTRKLSSSIVVANGQDSDGDGMSDQWEDLGGLDKTIPDQNNDPDTDTLTNLVEYQTGTDPRNGDSDGDKITDDDEINQYHTDPNISDTDLDGIDDNLELEQGSDPLDENSPGQNLLSLGDCNNDQSVGAADITALALEFFDGDDNNNPLAASGGSYPGTPACDANQDNHIGASDISCIARIFFNGAGACQPLPVSAAVAGQPVLSLPPQMTAAPGSTVTVPVRLQANGNPVSSLLFLLDYDETHLSFDPADNNQDGIPDAVKLNLPAPFQAAVHFDPNDTQGEIDVAIFNFVTPPAALSDGALLTLTLQAGAPASPTQAAVRFAQQSGVSLGSMDGRELVPVTQDGVVLITGTAVEEAGAPTLYLPSIMQDR